MKLTSLANLPLSQAEEEKYSRQLTKILDYVDLLKNVNTSQAKPAYNVSSNINIVRDDKVGSSLGQKEALQNAPVQKDGFFIEKGVFEGE